MPCPTISFSLLASLAFLQARALPISSPIIARGTNATLSPPSSYDLEEHSWQRNIYILQTTRLVLLICFTVLMHILWTRWRSSKPKLHGTVGDLQRALDAPMEVDMEDVNDGDDIAIDEDSEMSAIATAELQLDRRGSDRIEILCVPPRAHRSPPSRFREHKGFELAIAPYVMDPQSRTRATSMIGALPF